MMIFQPNIAKNVKVTPLKGSLSAMGIFDFFSQSLVGTRAFCFKKY